jgi:hypothetical protein
MLMARFQPLTWFYDVVVEEDGIRFVVLGKLTIHFLGRDRIEEIEEVGVASIGSVSAFNFKNRFLARSFMVRLKRGWYARQVLITPADAEQFEAWAKRHGASIK